VSSPSPGHLGAGDQRLGGPHRRLVSALGLADRVDLLVGLDRSDLADPVVGVDGDLDPALAERPRCRPGARGGIDTDSTPLSRTNRAYMSLRASRPPYS